MPGVLERGECRRTDERARDRFIPGLAGGRAEGSRGVDLAARTITGVASTINIDRHGEIVLPSAFAARAEQFVASNAPFAAAHAHRSESGSPTQIGWVMGLKIEAARVVCQFKFAETAVAEEWWKLASDAAGKGIAFSIGFYPVRWVYGTVADLVNEFPEIKRPVRDAGLKDDDRLCVYTEIELVEISAVMAPSNRQSLQLLAAKLFGLPSDADNGKALDELVERIATAVAAKGRRPEERDAAAAVLARAMADCLQPKLDALGEQLKAFVLEQLDEVRAVLPDPAGLLAGCPHDGEDPDAADGGDPSPGRGAGAAADDPGMRAELAAMAARLGG